MLCRPVGKNVSGINLDYTWEKIRAGSEQLQRTHHRTRRHDEMMEDGAVSKINVPVSRGDGGNRHIEGDKRGTCPLGTVRRLAALPPLYSYPNVYRGIGSRGLFLTD